MKTGDLKISDGSAAGAWIAPRLRGEFGAVTQHVPGDFEAYARIFHPAMDHGGHAVRWQEVARTVGTTVHSEMQWQCIRGQRPVAREGGASGSATWVGIDPVIGEMSIEELDTLCEILATNSGDTSQCYFGLCVIENWLESFSADEVQSLLSLPLGRDYIVLAGPLSAVDQIVRGECGRAAPNLIWPSDQSWLVISEVDFDSTLVGASSEVIQAIVESPALEAWVVEASASLAADADRINAASSCADPESSPESI
jgi:hypothetical protein